MTNSTTIIIGHKNPDTDSCASAVAYAALKTALGKSNVIAGCAGFPGTRTEYLFNKFNTPIPKVIKDVSPRIKDVMNTAPTVVYKGQTLLEAMEYITESQMPRIPVTDDHGEYVGMVSLFDLAGRMFQKARSTGGESEGDGVIGRGVNTSIDLAAKTLNARMTCIPEDSNQLSELNVYVGAMSIERLKSEILTQDCSKMVIVAGDRTEMHRVLVESRIKLLVVTGNSSVDLDLIQQAKEHGTSILQTPFDSATTVRRLKFSQPVELMLQEDAVTYFPFDKISDFYHSIISDNSDNFPVCDSENRLLGMVTKHDIDKEQPLKLILVDHNEIEQAVNGASEVPVIEILDHHRIGITPTDDPIVVTNDVVGSTCTLVTEKYRQFGIEPTVEVAGLLLGGVITDTLLLKSPTSTERDKIAIEYLEEKCGVKAKELMEEIFSVGSIVAAESPEYVINLDKKNYKSDTVAFSVSQVEESGFSNFYNKKEELLEELVKVSELKDVSIAALLVTDVVQENSLLLVAGSRKIINLLPFTKVDDCLYRLSGILSRKKQLIPELLKALNTK